MKIRFPGFTAVLLTSACILSAAVYTDYEHKTDFSRYHTYSWIGVRAGNSIWQGRITHAVDTALAEKGWTKVPSGGDAAISAFARGSRRETMETFYNGFPGWGWRARWWGGGMAATEAVPERVGNLTVDIFDGKTRQLIFRGRSSDTMTKNPDKNEKKIDHSVEEMFKKFPPRERG